MEFLGELPKDCFCFQNISEIKDNYPINYWIPNKRICIKKDANLTTASYFSSAFIENCKTENVCQKYFCKTETMKSCPIVDVYFDPISDDDIPLEDGITIKTFNRNSFDLHNATEYYPPSSDDPSIKENSIMLPVLDLYITRDGRCATQLNSLTINYPLLFENRECSKDGRFYTIDTMQVKEILNINGNYYDYLSQNLPLFNLSVTEDEIWNLDAKYAFYRNTLSCLMKNYDDINREELLGAFYSPEQLKEYNKQKLKVILTTFVDMYENYSFQGNVQSAILGLNVLVVSINLFIIAYKILKYFHQKYAWLNEIFENEVYITFTIDLSIAVLGGASYFILTNFTSYIDGILETTCVDSYMQYKLGIFSESLGGTSDENLQIFIFMLIKIFIILFSILYYFAAYSFKLNCYEMKQIIIDNINEGEGEDPTEMECIHQLKKQKDSCKHRQKHNHDDKNDDHKQDNHDDHNHDNHNDHNLDNHEDHSHDNHDNHKDHNDNHNEDHNHNHENRV